jgi:hypothetical protein
LTLAGPLYADMFVGKPFGVSMVFFAFTVFMGPIVAQPVGRFIVVNRDLGWQWTEYLCGILGAAALIPLVFTLKETYAPVILAKKAATIRDQSGDVSIGMTPGVGGLPYLGLIVGELFAVMAIFLMQPWIMMKAKTNQGLMMPEWQLPIAVPGAVAFSVGLFWYGWTGYKQQIHWIVPTLSGLLTGFGLLATFVPSISYLVQARPER